MCAPSFYFILVAAGFIPAIFYLYYVIGDIGTILLWGIHLLIYVTLYYFIAHIITRIFFKINNSKNRIVVLTVLILTLMIGSFFPIYTIGGHNSSQTTNIIGMYKNAGRISYVPW